VSYDDRATLAAFSKKHEIGYLLLSDPGSRTIDAYGIRNEEVRGSRMDGIPYPGTFIIDDQGVIRAKLFYDGYKTRHGAQEIIEAARDLDEAASP
jgi:peroxiredoxin